MGGTIIIAPVITKVNISVERRNLFRMLAQWTGNVVGKMHMHGISMKMLASEIGWHEKYLSAVLNGHRNPSGAEVKVSEALNRLISAKENPAGW